MNSVISKRLERQLRDWQPMDRDRFLHSRRLRLNDYEFLIWEAYSAFSDWNKKHIEDCGTFEVTDLETASVLGWSSAKTCRTRNSILKKGLITKIDLRRYRVHDLKEVASVNFESAPVQEDVAVAQEKIASVQVERGYFSSPSLVSYKNVFVSCLKVEYEAIVKELKFLYTDASDLEWIDSDIYRRQIKKIQQISAPVFSNN
ncbi:MAG: hypothetical protein AAB917_03190 [Patescibacteria group bacterium]